MEGREETGAAPDREGDRPYDASAAFHSTGVNRPRALSFIMVLFAGRVSRGAKLPAGAVAGGGMLLYAVSPFRQPDKEVLGAERLAGAGRSAHPGSCQPAVSMRALAVSAR